MVQPREVLVRFKGDPLRAAVRAACCEEYKGETILSSQPIQLVCLNEDGAIFSNMAYWPRTVETGVRVLETLWGASKQATENSTLQVLLLDALRRLTCPDEEEEKGDAVILCKHFKLSALADIGVLRWIHENDCSATSNEKSTDELGQIYNRDLSPHMHTIIFWQYA